MGVFSKNIGSDKELEPVDKAEFPKGPTEEELRAIAEAKAAQEAEEAARKAAEKAAAEAAAEAERRRFEEERRPKGVMRNGVFVIEEIKPDISFEYEGSVLIKGDVGKGAIVHIKNGSLTVEGHVDDNVWLTAESTKPVKSQTRVNVSNTSPSLKNAFQQASSIGDMFNKSANLDSGSSDFMKDVQAMVDHDRAAKSVDASIYLRQHVGHNARLKASNDIQILSAGNDLNAIAGNNFSAHYIGSKAIIKAGNSAEVKSEISNDSTVEAGNCFKAHIVHANTYIDVGNSADVYRVNEGVVIDAGNNITVREASRSSRLHAGNQTQVDQYTGTDHLNQSGRPVYRGSPSGMSLGTRSRY